MSAAALSAAVDSRKQQGNLPTSQAEPPPQASSPSNVSRSLGEGIQGRGRLRLPSPNAACPRRLCQPPWTHASRKETRPPRRRNSLRRSKPLKRQPLFGRGNTRKRPLTPPVPQRRMSAAALSAAVDSRKPQGIVTTPQAEPTPKASYPQNASRSSGEGVWGRGASLREAASPPRICPGVPHSPNRLAMPR